MTFMTTWPKLEYLWGLCDCQWTVDESADNIFADRRLHSFPAVNNDSTRYGSWPKLVASASSRYIQSRTFSEPINDRIADPSMAASTNQSSNSSGPTKNIRVNLRRRIEADINLEDIMEIPIIFVLGSFINDECVIGIEMIVNVSNGDFFIDRDSGGPGSGKLTHCHHLSQIDQKLVHVNMLTTFLDFVDQNYGTSIIYSTIHPYTIRSFWILDKGISKFEFWFDKYLICRKHWS